MKVIKRSGKEVDFDVDKIQAAIKKASDATESESLTDAEIEDISTFIEFKLNKLNRATSVEEIQNIVEKQIMSTGKFDIAKNYINYRYKRSLARQSNTTDEAILSLIDCTNEEVKQENSNKNPTINSVQRDYMAGEVSKDLTMRVLLPPDIVKAHKEGIIHFHDADYYAQHMHNCALINLDDMLQNGTVISGTLIEKPHGFSTACNIATQIIAQVSSSCYGGQTITLSALAPFVQISRDKIKRELINENKKHNLNLSDEQIREITEDRLKNEIKKGVQTIQYQIVTLLTTNGQAPFVTVFMYLNEVKDKQTKKDLAFMKKSKE